jgi:hypothetical protein
MKIHIDPVISSRIKQAWNGLTAAQQSQIAPLLARASQQAQMVTNTGQPPATPTNVQPHQLLLARSAINGDQDQIVSQLEAGAVITVGSGGEIWGTGKYQQLDPGWVEAGAVWLENLLKARVPFVATPQVINIPNSVRIAIAGDWGTGDWRTVANPAPSTDVARHMAFLRPDYSIHLGDTYYAGTADEEQHLMTALWPAGSQGSFALNSNHEMYSLAEGYFTQVLGHAKFVAQNGCGFFALQNNDWVIVGLDTAYYAPEMKLYLDGSLYPAGGPEVQLDFLKAQIATGKKVVILTHHGGLSLDGKTPNTLWQQVTSAFPAGGQRAYWYWGHEHAAVVYEPRDDSNLLTRCCGHGGIPWGKAPILDNNAAVAWFENRSAGDPDVPQRVMNGFVMLGFEGPTLKETFYDETGGEAVSLG